MNTDSEHPTPEGFVRLALPGEAAAIAEIQRRSWAGDADTGDLVAELAVDQLVRMWQTAILRPPLATFRVLVAVERTPGRERVTGFAALSPSSDPDSHEADDAEVEEFVIDPERRGHGHGSRLMQAVVDTLRADRFTRATWWIRATDDRLRTFLTGAGWDADGAHREVGTDDGSIRIKQIRMHTGI
ncbi:GNAT family N-acetyltransferase [Granulicoccus phenolivorans]|uniref:GNAT family N-acetyltransferase n=1 Tax=Granulicoccus phenolivorans TaxID=266854 RepID=UPI0003F5AB6E|nr:GNAT family N-acetyltransferase [Granulicoccus phenolivorans]